MAKKLYEKSDIVDIAEAIKEKNGDSQEKIKIHNLAQAIRDLPTGGGGSMDSVSVGVCVTDTIKDYVTVKDYIDVIVESAKEHLKKMSYKDAYVLYRDGDKYQMFTSNPSDSWAQNSPYFSAYNGSYILNYHRGMLATYNSSDGTWTDSDFNYEGDGGSGKNVNLSQKPIIYYSTRTLGTKEQAESDDRYIYFPAKLFPNN